MRARTAIAMAATAAVLAAGFADTLLAQRFGGRGSVSGSRGSFSREGGGNRSWQGEHASGSRSVSQTGEGYNVNRQVQTEGGYSKDVNRDINTEDRSIDRSSTATNPWGQSMSRDREVQNQGGYATIEGSASTNTGRYASGQAVAGRNAWGEPAVAGSVNTKYNGSYAGAAARNPYGGYTAATVGPYGGKVTTTLPSGYRTSTYYGRPYYTYGGAYYRPYTYGGVPYYYPVPMPYYAYYETPPVGATMLAVAGATYLVTKEGSYAQQTATASGSMAYQAVPAPAGATMTALPATRVLVTVGGETFFLYGNTFYRRVVTGAQEQFVVVTAPPGVVFVQALPPDFTVVQLNTMYFSSGGKYYVPFLSTNGSEMYAMVDTPPQPAATAPAPAAATPAATPGQAPAPAAVRSVEQSLVVPQGTLIVVRLASDISSATATQGDRFQGFLDQDLAANGQMIAPRGSKVFGIVTTVDRGSKGSGQPVLSVALTDIKVGDRVLPIQTAPLTVEGKAGNGGRKVVGAAGIGAAIGAIADGGDGAAIGAAIGGAAGAGAAAAGSQTAAVIPAQSPESFTVAAPFQVDVMTNVAVR